MKTLMFYCQHLLGIGHLIRSMEIARGLTQNFKVYFINGGEVIDGFHIPPGVEVVNLPPLKTDAEFQGLQAPAEFESVEAAMAKRKTILSISMAGYNTTLNVLTTGVRAILLPFTGNHGAIPK